MELWCSLASSIALPLDSLLLRGVTARLCFCLWARRCKHARRHSCPRNGLKAGLGLTPRRNRLSNGRPMASSSFSPVQCYIYCVYASTQQNNWIRTKHVPAGMVIYTYAHSRCYRSGRSGTLHQAVRGQNPSLFVTVKTFYIQFSCKNLSQLCLKFRALMDAQQD